MRNTPDVCLLPLKNHVQNVCSAITWANGSCLFARKEVVHSPSLLTLLAQKISSFMSTPAPAISEGQKEADAYSRNGVWVPECRRESFLFLPPIRSSRAL